MHMYHLDEVEASKTLALNHKDSKVAVRLFDTVVKHSNQNVGVLGEVHH